jgi:hypothetical protein
MDMWTYDPTAKKWRSYWFENGGSEAMISEGTAEGGKYIFTGAPISIGGTPKARYRSTTTKKTDKLVELLVEMEASPGKWEKMITGTYTKQ